MEKSVAVTTYKPSIAEVKGSTEWSELEQALLDACKTGEPAVPKDAVPPDNMDDSAAVIVALRPKNPSDPSRRVRASLIRYLLLGGCGASNGTRPHPKGVNIWGGWIDGALVCSGGRFDGAGGRAMNAQARMSARICFSAALILRNPAK